MLYWNYQSHEISFIYKFEVDWIFQHAMSDLVLNAEKQTWHHNYPLGKKLK